MRILRTPDQGLDRELGHAIFAPSSDTDRYGRAGYPPRARRDAGLRA
ncbi:MAG: hypothetical protein OXN89_07900 [Bryobacterales bacterium]|nr:hypothetical protein [Bryobacterales bacterium]